MRPCRARRGWLGLSDANLAQVETEKERLFLVGPKRVGWHEISQFVGLKVHGSFFSADCVGFARPSVFETAVEAVVWRAKQRGRGETRRARLPVRSTRLECRHGPRAQFRGARPVEIREQLCTMVGPAKGIFNNKRILVLPCA